MSTMDREIPGRLSSRVHKTVAGIAVASGFVLCWSSGFVGSRLSVVSEAPALSLYAWRFLLAALMAGAWCALYFRGYGRPPMKLSLILHEASIGTLTVGVYLLAMLLAVEAGVSVGLTALIGALQPLATLVLASGWLGHASRPLQWIGMGIATLGAGLGITDDFQSLGNAPLWAYGLPVLSVAAVTLGSVLTLKKPSPLPLITRMMLQWSAASLLFFGAAVIESGVHGLAPPPLTEKTLSALAWLVLLATFGGYGFFNAGLQRFGATTVAALIALTPATTIVWATLMFDEYPGVLGCIGVLLGLLGAGMALLNRPSRSYETGVTAIRQ